MKIGKEHITPVLETKFLSLLDIQYESGKHYFNTTRRGSDDVVAVKSDKEFKEMLPDAVSCIVILEVPDEEPKLLLSYEYRYPAGRFLLSVPAGLIDEQDKANPNAIVLTAIREIQEEIGLTVKETDSITVINPLVFSSPGMTDESNALVCVIMRSNDLSELSQKGAQGSEHFDGFELLTQDAAFEVLRNGRDKNGNFYPVYTWAALSYFVSGTWKTDFYPNEHFEVQKPKLKTYKVSFHADCMTGTESYRVTAKNLDSAKELFENYIQNTKTAHFWRYAIRDVKHHRGYIKWEEVEGKEEEQGVNQLPYHKWNSGSDHIRD